MSNKKKIFKSVLVYFVGNVLSRSVLFFLIPVYTRFIPAGDMGQYDMAIALVTLISAIIFLELWLGALRFVIDKKEIRDKYVAVYSACGVMLCSIGVYIVLSVVVGAVFDIQYFVWIALYGLLLCVWNIYNNFARGFGYNKFFMLSGLANTLVSVAFKIIFLTVLDWNYSALFIAACIGLLASIVLLEIRCKVIINFRIKYFDKQIFRELLRFCWPLAINGIAYWTLSSINRVLVTAFLGTEYTGLLAIAARFSMILMLVSTSFQLVWQELSFARDNKTDSKTGEYYSKAFDLNMRIMMIGILVIIPAVFLGLTVFPWFIDAEYYGAQILIPLSLIGTTLGIWSIFLGSIFGGIKKTKMVLICTIVGAIVNLAVILSLINALGVIAAPIALISGFSANVLVRTLLLKKAIGLKVKYWYFAVFAPFLAGAVLIYIYLSWVFNLVYLTAVAALGIILFRKTLFQLINIIRTKGQPVQKTKEEILLTTEGEEGYEQQSNPQAN